LLTRQAQPEIELHVALAITRVLDLLLESLQIVRMDAIFDQLERYGRFRVDLEDAVAFIRPRDLVRGNAPYESTRRAETLCFGEKRAASLQFALLLPQSRFRQLAFGDFSLQVFV